MFTETVDQCSSDAPCVGVMQGMVSSSQQTAHQDPKLVITKAFVQRFVPRELTADHVWKCLLPTTLPLSVNAVSLGQARMQQEGSVIVVGLRMSWRCRGIRLKCTHDCPWPLVVNGVLGKSNSGWFPRKGGGKTPNMRQGPMTVGTATIVVVSRKAMQDGK